MTGPGTGPGAGSAGPEGPATELVVLLDEAGTPSGTAPKAGVHTTDTPLHLAFSCHVLDEGGRVLVTRRALGKAAWPGVWTNAVCGHPAPGESFADAIARRADFELGCRVEAIECVLPDFRYRAVDDSGVVENEVCPVYTARIVGGPDALAPRDAEVAAWRWAEPLALGGAVRRAPFAFSPWFVRHVTELPELYGRD